MYIENFTSLPKMKNKKMKMKKHFSKSVFFSEMCRLLILLPLLVIGVYSDDNCKSVRADFQACTQQ